MRNTQCFPAGRMPSHPAPPPVPHDPVPTHLWERCRPGPGLEGGFGSNPPMGEGGGFQPVSCQGGGGVGLEPPHLFPTRSDEEKSLPAGYTVGEHTLREYLPLLGPTFFKSRPFCQSGAILGFSFWT